VVTGVLAALASSWPVHALLGFIALYPMVTAVVWVVTALIYAGRREGPASEDFYAIPDEQLPLVTVLVPAYREETGIGATLEALHDLDYPRYEVLVVDDGSPDATAAIAEEHVLRDVRFRLLAKTVNEGKALAMNDAMPLVRGSVVVVVDADARLHRDALRAIVAHFVRLPRVAAVTGNPRVANRHTLVAELQTLEFSSIVSLLRRAQVVWGRVLTVSGVVSAFRVSALRDVGMFDPSMATEDIDVSWRLQRRFYDVRYEPRALVDMTVPSTFTGLWRQRRRWALGLVQVLRRHRAVIRTWKNRRHWPVFVEAVLSVVWAHAFLVMLGFWALCLSVGVAPPGASPFPNAWGMVVATACLVQLAIGVRLDRRYDRSVCAAFWIAPLYPLGYWLMMSLVTVRSTIPALLKPQPSVARWSTVRESVPTAVAKPEAWVPETLAG
jgi:biofilm PGA synthesis N-glycosyltransferase PgaC